MITPSLPASEPARLAALLRYDILDTGSEQGYEDLLAIAAGICGTSMGSVSLVDSHRQWFKAQRGLPVSETPRDIAFCAHAILQPQEIMVVPDARIDDRFHDNPLVTGTPHIRFYAGAPLVGSDGEAIGTLCVMDSAPRDLDTFQLQALAGLSRQIVALLELRLAYQELRRHLSEREWYERHIQQYQQQLVEENAQLTEENLTDVLTGLPNRRACNAVMESALAASATSASPLALAIIDIDHFKLINDVHGHPVGDETLATVAQALKAQCGMHGLVARFGGEEFAAVLSDATLADAEQHCEHMRKAVEHLPQCAPITVSIGVAAMRPGDALGNLYARADKALYAAKHAGRNCVVAVA